MNTNLKNYFKQLSQTIFKELKSGEHLFLNLTGDDSQFIRINGSKIRQSGVVENYFLDFTFIMGEKEGSLKTTTAQITLTMNETLDLKNFLNWIHQFREELPNFPIDPYAVLPSKNSEDSVQENSGKLLSREEAVINLIEPWNDKDVAGFYAGGIIVRAMANSAGLFHWFLSENFTFDFSLYTPAQKALKMGYSGSQWNSKNYIETVYGSIKKLEALEKKSIKIKPGDYRVYLAPAALCDVIEMLGGVFGEQSIQQNQSSIRLVRSGDKSFSKKFTLTDDFSEGFVPRFNEEGDLAPEKMSMIENGVLKSTLISTHSAKEYKLVANGADSSEGLRSPVVLKGKLSESQILSELGTGLYLSNLHYLNWSDEVNGRITGMTRYACFWVENGKIICPIENLRFDETIFDLLGSSVVEFTDFDEYCPVTSTYFNRQIGGVRTPGVLLSKMSFTL